MDLDLSNPPNRLTPPAKPKAEESPAAKEYDILSNRLKALATSGAIEDDLPSDLKSEDDLVPKNHEAEITPEAIEDNQKDEETPVGDQSSDGDSDDWPYPWPRFKPEPPREIPNEEHIVVELPNAYSDSPQSHFRPEESVESDDDGDDDVFSDEEDKRNYELYVEEYAKSEGFDLEHFSDKIFGGLMPLALDEKDPYFVDCTVTRDCKKSVEAALRHTNQRNNWNLELEKITKCNYVVGTRYYATFDAKDTDAGVTRTFQTQVRRDHSTGKTTIIRFRVKPEPEQ